MYPILTVLLFSIVSATHIVKLKSFVGIATASDMILNHHKDFLLFVRKNRQSSHNLKLEQIHVGRHFNAVQGVFSDHAFLEYLYKQSTVEYIEEIQTYQSTTYQDDDDDEEDEDEDEDYIKTEKPTNWGLARIGQRQEKASDSYSYDPAGGSGVSVYVLDTGVYTKHNDFDQRATQLKNCVSDVDEDLGGHGTHVAAKIAGREYGVAKSAMIKSIKVMNRRGLGSTSGLLRGIEHIARVAKDKSVVNLSLTGPPSRLIDDALNELVLTFGIPVFASAGNRATDACFFTPSSNPNVFVVGASDPNDRVSRFSNTGECVSIYAPGSNILSAYIGAANSSRSMDGTSMACPHVSGVAANLMSSQNFTSPHELYRLIQSSATPNLLDFVQSSLPNNNLLLYHSV